MMTYTDNNSVINHDQLPGRYNG